MGRLPDLPYAEQRTRSVQRRFGGYRHTIADFDCALYDMENLCSDGFPLTRTRPPRRSFGTLGRNNGIYSMGEHLILADGTALSLNGVAVGEVADSPKTFAALGDRVLIFPDKLYLNCAALGRYETLAALSSEVTTPVYGDIYAVGTEAPYDLYYWNGSSLRISPLEQVELLEKLYNNEFGFDEANVNAIKDAIFLSDNNGNKF